MTKLCKSIDYSYLCYENDTISDALPEGWEQHLLQKAEEYLTTDSVILDIGANIGTWAIPLAKEKRIVHAFEPYNLSFYALCGNIFLNQKFNIFPHHTALIDNPNKKTKLFISEYENQGGCKLIDTTDDIPHQYTLATLDSFQFDRVDFIKLDVEGQELNVLRGGIQTIRRHKPVILFECWDIDSHHWDGIPNTHDELKQFITSLCYTIHPIDDDNYLATYLIIEE